MSGKGKYWDKALSLVEGCKPVSPGCDNCWLAAIDYRFNKGFSSKGRFNGDIFLHSERLSIPLKTKKPTVYAVWSDLFHPDVPFNFFMDAFDIMARCEQHTFLVLTKRPEIMLRHFNTARHGAPGGELREFPHIYWGVTAENQEQADKRIPILLQIPAAKRFVSIEPMLGPIKFKSKWSKGACPEGCETVMQMSCNRADQPCSERDNGLDAVILGGESGRGARPMHLDWARGVRDDCAAAGTNFFFKQHGEWGEYGMVAESCQGRTVKSQMVTHGLSNILMLKVGLKKAGRLLDGREHNELPWRIKG